MAEIPLQGIDRNIDETGPVDGDGLHLVVIEGGRAMDIDKGEFFRRDMPEHIAQGFVAPLARPGRTRDMVRIIPDRTVHEFPARIPESEDDGGCGFSEVQSVPMGVEGFAGGFRKGLQGLETRHNETRLDLRTDHDDLVETAAQEHPPSLQQGRQPGNAGIGHHHRRIRIAEGIHQFPGGRSQGNILRANMFYISFDGREDERRPGTGRVDAGGLHGPPGRFHDDRIKEG